MQLTLKEIQAVQCPLCSEQAGQPCRRLSGEPCFEPHQDRRWAATDKKKARLYKSRNRSIRSW